MKASTVTAIRRKLVGSGCVRLVEVPDFARIGCELLVFSFGRLVSYPPLKERLPKVSDLLEKKEIVFCLMEPGQDFMVQLSRNYTRAIRNILSIEEGYQFEGFVEEPIDVVAFPYETSRVPRYFDFSPVLDALFGCEENERLHGSFFGRGPTRLTRKESLVLAGMAEDPGATDTELSERLGISRMTVGRARRKFREERLTNRIWVPDLAKIGVRLIVVTYASFHPGFPLGRKHNLEKTISLLGPAFLCAYDSRKIVSVSAFRSFEDYKRRTHESSETPGETKYFSRPPKRLLFSVEQSSVVRDHKYDSLVRGLLRLDPHKESPT